MQPRNPHHPKQAIFTPYKNLSLTDEARPETETERDSPADSRSYSYPNPEQHQAEILTT